MVNAVASRLSRYSASPGLPEAHEERDMTDDPIPAWALQAADDFHGGQEIDRPLALMISERMAPSIMARSRYDRDALIEQMIAKETS